MFDDHDEPLCIAYYCTGHGLGHATRAVEICKHLVRAGHSVICVTGAPAQAFLRELPPAHFTVRRAVLDCGSLQSDALTVDMQGSLEEYHRTAVLHRATILESEVSWLTANRVDLVVSDIVPLAFVAAHKANVTSVAVTNFSWDFIYSEYLASSRDRRYHRLVWQIAQDYTHAAVLLRLPGFVPMPAFSNVVDVPLVVRHAARPPAEVRAELGVAESMRLLVLVFGGHRLSFQLQAKMLPDGWMCVVCAAIGHTAQEDLPPGFLLAPANAFVPDLVRAGDCVMGKVGYGTMSECLAHRRPLLFVRRQYFNEEPFLRKMLEKYDAAVEVSRRDFLEGNWSPYLSRALELEVCFDEPTNGAEVVARRLVDVARGGGLTPTKRSAVEPLDRLREAVVFGYLMQRHSMANIDLPDWYQASAGDVSPRSTWSPRYERADELQVPASVRLLGGRMDLEELPDTIRFLGLLSDLATEAVEAANSTAEPCPSRSTSYSSLHDSGHVMQLPERRAARAILRADLEVVVARAPGRLDVMGGIADYSGSEVLQYPIQEACHVALQRQPTNMHHLWRHAQERQKGQPPRAVFSVVSFNADATNRGPTFDIELRDLLSAEGEPVSYAQAHQIFRRELPTSWAAYVAGALVVLMREKGWRCHDSIACLVASDVPEGKGISSSAAVEVATLKALSASFHIPISGRELALLCQKVENLVVGAPCGVMDQMSSSLGRAGHLLRLLCQPAEVLGHISIPATVKFWGIDSGIRHSVGGSSYSSVRVGAFMGLRILSRTDADARPPQHDGVLPEPSGGQRPQLVGGGYLANLPLSTFRMQLEARLPAKLLGRAFLRAYGPHCDAVTEVEPDVEYEVAHPTQHPVAEMFRVQTFCKLLQGMMGSKKSQGSESDCSSLRLLGEVMMQSHASYSRCGLGCSGTDRILELVLQHIQERENSGLQPLLYGAKITGGGSGGTVCIVGHSSSDAEAAVQRLAAVYSQETGYAPKIFSGTSMGATEFDHIRMQFVAMQRSPPAMHGLRLSDTV